MQNTDKNLKWLAICRVLINLATCVDDLSKSVNSPTIQRNLWVLRTCNGAEYQVKIFLSMPIYAFHGAILGVFLLVELRCVLSFKRCP